MGDAGTVAAPSGAAGTAGGPLAAAWGGLAGQHRAGGGERAEGQAGAPPLHSCHVETRERIACMLCCQVLAV